MSIAVLLGVWLSCSPGVSFAVVPGVVVRRGCSHSEILWPQTGEIIELDTLYYGTDGLLLSRMLFKLGLLWYSGTLGTLD